MFSCSVHEIHLKVSVCVKQWCVLDAMTKATLRPVSQQPNRASVKVHKLHLCSTVILFSCRFWCGAISQMSGLKELLVQHIDLDGITERRAEEERGGKRGIHLHQDAGFP